MSDFAADPIAVLEDLKQRLRRVALTDVQFASSLNPVLAAFAGKGLYITIQVSDLSGTPQKTYGSSPGQGLTDGTRREEPANTDTAHISIVEERRSDVDAARMRELFTRSLGVLQSLLASHWGTRDSLTFVFNKDQTERFKAAIRDAVSSGVPVALVAFDLDKFKQVNDTHGHPAGDHVLREFGRRLRAQFAEFGLLGRFGGEEFTLAWIGARLEPLVRALTAFRQQQEREPYQAIDRPNTCSIGVAMFPEFVTQVGNDPYEVLNKVADDALYKAKDAGRNRIKWGSDRSPTPIVETVDAQALLQIALNSKVFARGEKIAKYGPLQSYIYSELRARLRTSSISETRSVIDQLLAEIGVDISEGTDAGRPTVSRRELVEIVATAFFGNALSGDGPLTAGNRIEMRAPDAGGDIVLQLRDGTGRVELPARIEGPAHIDLGEIWRNRENHTDGVARYVAPETSLSPYVTIAVGPDNLKRNGMEWSASTIPVDDRPITGGGLPDFWQSNVTRAVQAVLANPNARIIVILGDETTARRTITMLQQLVASNDADWRITRRLGLDPPVLRDFLDRKIVVHVVSVAESFLEVTRRLVLGAGPELNALGMPREVAAEAEQRARFSILTPRDTALGETDGMRVATLADAYPRVIQLLRSSVQEPYSDFMGREFVELSAFKISLTQPTTDTVPEYWSDDINELKTYYDREFRSQTGLFGARLQRWGDGESQITKAVGAATDALISGVASRRILFVVPRPADEWRSPVGLISACVLPRIQGDQRRIDFLWMWRTVEALVGFPFSAYGSITQSMFLLDKINETLRQKGEREAVCGELIYFAASLHFFLGGGDAEIARTVVRDAIR
jgi:diguanylate cyclase (GGDEF)-like protein